MEDSSSDDEMETDLRATRQPESISSKSKWSWGVAPAGTGTADGGLSDDDKNEVLNDVGTTPVVHKSVPSSLALPHYNGKKKKNLAKGKSSVGKGNSSRRSSRSDSDKPSKKKRRKLPVAMGFELDTDSDSDLDVLDIRPASYHSARSRSPVKATSLGKRSEHLDDATVMKSTIPSSMDNSQIIVATHKKTSGTFSFRCGLEASNAINFKLFRAMI